MHHLGVNVLKLDNVTKVFGNSTAVDRASFEVSSPMMIGVIGASGAGKSTLLRMLNRLEDVTDGSIIYEGQEISQLSGKDMRLWQSNCAMIFQQFNLVRSTWRIKATVQKRFGSRSYKTEDR